MNIFLIDDLKKHYASWNDFINSDIFDYIDTSGNGRGFINLNGSLNGDYVFIYTRNFELYLVDLFEDFEIGSDLENLFKFLYYDCKVDVFSSKVDNFSDVFYHGKVGHFFIDVDDFVSDVVYDVLVEKSYEIDENCIVFDEDGTNELFVVYKSDKLPTHINVYALNFDSDIGLDFDSWIKNMSYKVENFINGGV